MSRRMGYIVGWAAVLLVFAFLLGPGQAFGRELTPLTDKEMDGVYAEGLYFQLDLSLDIRNATSVQLQGGNLEDLQNLLQDGLTWQSGGSAGATAGVGAMLDSTGSLNPSSLGDSIYIGGNALQNTQNLFNLVVLGGDVAVGINITVVLNPVGSNINVYSFNFNFSDFDGSL